MAKEIDLTKANVHMLGVNSYCEELVIPHKFTYQGEDYIVEGINFETFKEWKNLKKVTIENGIEYIGDDVFHSCVALEEIIIPDSVEGIGANAFDSCTSLTSVNIPVGVAGIEFGTFYKCKSLTSIIIPNTIWRIEEKAFWGCTSLTNVTIPDSVQYIGYSAFRDCESLKEVTILGDDRERIVTNDTIDTGYNLKLNRQSLREAILLGAVIEIDDDDDDYDDVLEAEDIDGIEIREAAFAGCSNLTRVTIPYGVGYIGDGAFGWCWSLEEITIPDSVIKIGEDAFKDIPVVYYNGSAKGAPWGAKSIVATKSPTSNEENKTKQMNLF